MKIQLFFFAVVWPVCAQELPCSCHFGLVARDSFNLNGNNFHLDSFDSTDLTKSTGGLYDAAKKQANGNIAVGVALTNSVEQGNADLYGVIVTSPTGTVSGIGANGSIGPTFVTQDRATTVAAAEAVGWVRHDCGLFMSSVVLPQGATWVKAGIGSGNGNISKSTTLNSGDWIVDAVSLNSSQSGDTLTIAGYVRLYVTGSCNLSGLGQIVINPGASLTVYTGGNVTIAGQAVVNNTGKADNNVWFALDTSTSWSVDGNGQFIGVIYAPNAIVNFKAGGANLDAVGAIMAKNITLTANARFHYDEALHSLRWPWYRMCAGPSVDDVITDIQFSETNAAVRFPASVGKAYFLQYRDNAATGDWVSVGSTNTGRTTLSCTNEVLTIQHSHPGILSQRFYRLRIQSLP